MLTTNSHEVPTVDMNGSSELEQMLDTATARVKEVFALVDDALSLDAGEHVFRAARQALDLLDHHCIESLKNVMAQMEAGTAELNVVAGALDDTNRLVRASAETCNDLCAVDLTEERVQLCASLTRLIRSSSGTLVSLSDRAKEVSSDLASSLYIAEWIKIVRDEIVEQRALLDAESTNGGRVSLAAAA